MKTKEAFWAQLGRLLSPILVNIVINYIFSGDDEAMSVEVDNITEQINTEQGTSVDPNSIKNILYDIVAQAKQDITPHIKTLVENSLSNKIAFTESIISKGDLEMSNTKKANPGELAETVVTTLAPLVVEKVSGGIQAGEQIDPHAAIDEVASQEGIQVDETTRQELVQKVDEAQRNMMQTMEQEATTFASNSRRELMFKLGKVYENSKLNLTEAVKIWKQAKLNPTNIRDQIQNDVGTRVSIAEAKILHTLGSDLMLGMSDLDFGKAYANDILQKLMTKKSVKLTPTVREAVERVGQNMYRTKRASNIMWKIDVKHTDDGQQVPYLLRLENVEAEDGNPTKGSK